MISSWSCCRDCRWAHPPGGWVVGERAGNGDSLATWPTESCEGGMRRGHRTNFLDQAAGAAGALGARPGCFEHRDLDVLEGSQSWHQIEGLEDEADFGGAEGVDIKA